MLPPSKASGLARTSATSIWSRLTPEGAVSVAMRRSVSPRWTSRVLPPAGAASRAACAGAVRAAGARVLSPPGTATGSTGAGRGMSAGSSRKVYSRTSRPEDQFSSISMSR